MVLRLSQNSDTIYQLPTITVPLQIYFDSNPDLPHFEATFWIPDVSLSPRRSLFRQGIFAMLLLMCSHSLLRSPSPLNCFARSDTTYRFPAIAFIVQRSKYWPQPMPHHVFYSPTFETTYGFRILHPNRTLRPHLGCVMALNTWISCESELPNGYGEPQEAALFHSPRCMYDLLIHLPNTH